MLIVSEAKCQGASKTFWEIWIIHIFTEYLINAPWQNFSETQFFGFIFAIQKFANYFAKLRWLHGLAVALIEFCLQCKTFTNLGPLEFQECLDNEEQLMWWKWKNVIPREILGFQQWFFRREDRFVQIFPWFPSKSV